MRMLLTVVLEVFLHFLGTFTGGKPMHCVQQLLHVSDTLCPVFRT